MAQAITLARPAAVLSQAFPALPPARSVQGPP